MGQPDHRQRHGAFVIYMPTIEDVERFRDSREKSKKIPPDVNRILNLKEAINARVMEVNKLKSITFDPEYYKWIRSKWSVHYEDILYERLLLGYWIMKSETLEEDLFLTLDDEIKRVISQQMKARLEVQRGVNRIKISDVLRKKQHIHVDELRKILLSLSIEEKIIERDLQVLQANNLIKIDKDSGIVTNTIYVGDE